MSEETTILQTWDVPSLGAGESVNIQGLAGQATLIVGANGAGKSALGGYLEQNGQGIRRLLAHRKLWFEAPGPAITPADSIVARNNLKSWSMSHESRYLDRGSTYWTNIVLYDLLAKINHENAQLAKMYRAKATRKRIDSSLKIPLLDRLNALFKGASLNIEFELTENSTFEAHHIVRQATYPITQMSDGEKSALLLAAEIMTAPSTTTFIIDEPERHLNRAISAGLMEAIITDRPDCHFVVLTHDLELAATLSDSMAQKYVLSDCNWSGQAAINWDLHLVSTDSSIPDETRRAILGGRKQLLFLEGQMNSLDLKLYRILYPNKTSSPMGSCEQVIRAVTGIRASNQQHWLEASGIVDGDGRSQTEIQALKIKGVHVLPASEVESLYYLEPILRTIAAQQSSFLGLDADEMFNDAVTAGLASLREPGVSERLVASVAKKVITRRATEQLPLDSGLATSGEEVVITVPSPYNELLALINKYLEENNFIEIVRNFPIRDTGARNKIARAMKFQYPQDYEDAVLVRVRADSALTNKLLKTIGDLP